MNKMNREMNEHIMNQSKEKTIDFVMTEINKKPAGLFNKSFFRVKLVPALVLLFALVLVLIFSISTDPFTPTTHANPLLDNSNQERLVQLSYITGNLVVSSFTADSGVTLMRLADVDETEFEGDIVEFNAYFDMLRVFLEDDPFKSNFAVEILEEGDYAIKITFTVDNDEYIFLVNLDDTVLSGTLEVKGIILEVTGKLEEKNNELKFDIKAINNLNYIEIEYQVETTEEIEKTYEITSYINGITKNKTIEITIENEETKVKIKEDNKEYELEKTLEDGVIVYNLKYTIGEIEGEATIIETIDILGNKIYKYQISEDGYEKEIEIERDQDHEDDDDEEDQMNPNIGESSKNIL